MKSPFGRYVSMVASRRGDSDEYFDEDDFVQPVNETTAIHRPSIGTTNQLPLPEDSSMTNTYLQTPTIRARSYVLDMESNGDPMKPRPATSKWCKISLIFGTFIIGFIVGAFIYVGHVHNHNGGVAVESTVSGGISVVNGTGSVVGVKSGSGNGTTGGDVVKTTSAGHVIGDDHTQPIVHYKPADSNSTTSIPSAAAAAVPPPPVASSPSPYTHSASTIPSSSTPSKSASKSSQIEAQKEAEEIMRKFEAQARREIEAEKEAAAIVDFVSEIERAVEGSVSQSPSSSPFSPPPFMGNVGGSGSGSGSGRVGGGNGRGSATIYTSSDGSVYIPIEVGYV